MFRIASFTYVMPFQRPKIELVTPQNVVADKKTKYAHQQYLPLLYHGTRKSFMAAYLRNSGHVLGLREPLHNLERIPLLFTGHQQLAEVGVSANGQEEVGIERERR